MAIHYLLWHDQILSIIIGYGLESVIDSSIPPPFQFLPNSVSLNSENASWNRMNNLVKSWFYGFISPSMQFLLPRGSSIVDQWKTFESVFSASSQLGQWILDRNYRLYVRMIFQWRIIN